MRKSQTDFSGRVKSRFYLFLPLLERCPWRKVRLPVGTVCFLLTTPLKCVPVYAFPDEHYGKEALTGRKQGWFPAWCLNTGWQGLQEANRGGLLHVGESGLQRGGAPFHATRKWKAFFLCFIGPSLPFLLLAWVVGLYVARECKKRRINTSSKISDLQTVSLLVMCLSFVVVVSDCVCVFPCVHIPLFVNINNWQAIIMWNLRRNPNTSSLR